jgi:hypothetical protein
LADAVPSAYRKRASNMIRRPPKIFETIPVFALALPTRPVNLDRDNPVYLTSWPAHTELVGSADLISPQSPARIDPRYSPEHQAKRSSRRTT